MESVMSVQMLGLLDALAERVYKDNKKKGFWMRKFNLGEKLMLITSELGEALEADRKDRYFNRDDVNYVKESFQYCTPEGFKIAFEEKVKDTVQDELADAIIRIFDLAGGLDMDLAFHVLYKLHYNSLREPMHGKGY